MRIKVRSRGARRGVLAVEAAVVMPLLLIMMLGIWEVGRMIQVQQIMVNAAREGARMAAGGYIDSKRVTSSMVQETVRTYLSRADLPTAAVNGAQITLTCLVAPGWVDPADAAPLDRFRVRVVIPAGAPFESLRWSFVSKITNKNQMEAVVDWVSLNNVEISVDTQLPL